MDNGFPCDTYLQGSRVIQARDKDEYVVTLYFTCASIQGPISSIYYNQMFRILISVHEQRVGNTSGCMIIFSKLKNLDVSVKKIIYITLLLTHCQGRIDRTFVLPSGKTCLTSPKSSAWFDTTSTVGVSEVEGIITKYVYTPHSTIKARPSFQPRLAPPLVVLNNTFGMDMIRLLL